MRRARTVVVTVIATVAALASPAAAETNDPYIGAQWGLERIGAEAAWGRTTGVGVRIGIVDTGVDLTHEDLAGKVVAHASCLGSWGNPAACRGSAKDEQGHGTHVAGIAAALMNNGKGIAGVAPDASLVVAKVVDRHGGVNAADVMAGVKWVVDHGAQVVNLSLGDAFLAPLLGQAHWLQDGIDYAWSHGAVPIVAAGNSNAFGLGVEGLPHRPLNAIVVGATGPDDRVARYSTSTGGARWAVLAPGGEGGHWRAHDVFSTLWSPHRTNNYGFLSGTSMAAPHVSGAIALLLARGYTKVGAVQRLLETADHSVRCGLNSPTCQGRIDVALAVAGIRPGGDHQRLMG